MPRIIESYKRQEQEAPQSPKPIPKIPSIIIFLVLAFLYLSSADAHAVISSHNGSQAEKSRICLGEFTQKRCDSLNLSDDCRKLLECVQLQKEDFYFKMITFGKALSEEIQREFHLPAALIGLLLLLQIVQAKTSNH